MKFLQFNLEFPTDFHYKFFIDHQIRECPKKLDMSDDAVAGSYPYIRELQV